MTFATNMHQRIHLMAAALIILCICLQDAVNLETDIHQHLKLLSKFKNDIKERDIELRARFVLHRQISLKDL